jgi:hypothetical protein
MEGILTVIIGVLSIFFLIGYPQDLKDSSGFLTESEMSIVLSLLEKDRKDTEGGQKFQWSSFIKPAMDLTVWSYGFLYT